MMYYSHNLHFLAVVEAVQGRYAEAKKAAEKLAQHVGPHVKDMPMLEGFLPVPTLILARFRKWDEILNSPAPDTSMAITRALWHFTRGVAYAATNRVQDAEKERAAFLAARKAVPEDAVFSQVNKASAVFAVAEALLDARIALARQDRKTAIEKLRAAAAAEDALNYMEPSDWILPVRETLGGVLLAEGNAAEAEKVFRADLEKNRRSPRSLFGLRESLKAQGKTYAAQLVDMQFQQAWKNADQDVRLAIADL
jgi:tetratricopeptide (TPR) repeat protein